MVLPTSCVRQDDRNLQCARLQVDTTNGLRLPAKQEQSQVVLALPTRLRLLLQRNPVLSKRRTTSRGWRAIGRSAFLVRTQSIDSYRPEQRKGSVGGDRRLQSLDPMLKQLIEPRALLVV